MSRLLCLFALFLSAACPWLSGTSTDFAALREQVRSLASLTQSPRMYPAEGVPADGLKRPIFFEGLPYRGKATRVFAWIGTPASSSAKVPGVVLVHGGGGTAFKEWVQLWNDQGFAAISIAVEGQTDVREQETTGVAKAAWRRHDASGPSRNGIYGDADAPLQDQWMYHAVAASILANSLLRSMPEVDASRIGLCGISWGGIIATTVAGIDSRFAFAIPIYGCGALDRADNQYGRALREQAIYKQVWEPLLRLPDAKMPMLWLTGPNDSHFPLSIQQLSYRTASGPRMVSVPWNMKHSHPAGWNPPDSYAFAKAVVATGKPWGRQTSQSLQEGRLTAVFESSRSIDAAYLLYRKGSVWERTPAAFAHKGSIVQVDAQVPPDSEACFINLESAGLTLSSECVHRPQVAQKRLPSVPDFSWDRVPLNIHFGKRSGDLSDEEIDFLAKNSRLIALEKSHGVSAHGSTEAGIAATARRLKKRNPSVKVLFYFNAFINWPGYAAFDTYKPEWTLRTADGKVLTHPSGTPRPDPSNAAFREWWSEVVAKAHREAPLDGLFADALPQALSPGLARQVGEAKARAIVQGLRAMLVLAKRKLGPDRLIVANGLRTTDFRELLDWEGIDGVMIEHFAAFKTDAPQDIKADLDSIGLAADRGKFVIVKGWPGFNWLDTGMMKRPYAELLALARERIRFPLACFLVAAREGSHFCYSWGYTDRHGMLDAYDEFQRPLGAPKGDAVWNGLCATREFEHAAVSVDLDRKTASIIWR